MTPKTKREFEVVELSSKLPLIDKYHEWAKDKVFPHIAYKCKDELWCGDCGGMWVATDEELACNNGSIECPYCHKKLVVKVSRKIKEDKVTYMTVATVIKGYQVLRHIYCERWSRKRGSSANGIDGVGYYFDEVVQEWIDNKGKRIVMAKPRNMGSTGWIYSQPMSIKKEWGSSYYGTDYAIWGTPYPKKKIIPELKKRGLIGRMPDTTLSYLFINLLRGNNDYELCLKTKQISMLKFMAKTGHYQIRYKPSFNICNRNHYIIKDASMWVDYINLLDYFHKDIRNAKYVCPKNLKKEHDILMMKKQKIEEEQRRQRDHERAIKEAIKRKENILKFYRMNERFFGIEIKGEGITIHPLESVTQFYQEAKAMHHCVFAASYYSHPDCLILSARDSAGNRLETIEINLKTFQIVQSRAVCNGRSERHDDIINLVKKNIKLIKQRTAA